jgi:DNA-binding Lrp family transcriptional regulator
MVTAYVLIVTEPGATRRVAVALRDLVGVSEVHEVMGPYDVVAELEGVGLTDLPPLVADTIRAMDGVQSTTSLVAFPQSE